MIKQLLPFALAFALLLSACGGDTKEKEYDPAATAAALQESTAFSDALEALDKDVAAILYGLEEGTVQDCAVYTSLSAGAEEIAVLVLSDTDATSAALTALKNRVEDQKTALKDYQPAEVSKLDHAIIQQRGNSVLLVVAADPDAAQAVLDKQ
ncbi:MAG: DUF4358 domain-containing protein [Oscillospiraceae bacterium]|nr:DUF4358 domain-containing protein [Oscillospiraceae bacterium]